MSLRLNREILRLTVPAIVSNITMPLMALCDTGVSGHLGSEIYIGAIAVGTMMQNVVFWLFGFLRMGTTGLTAQHFGANDDDGCRAVFSRAVVLGLLIGALLVLLQKPLTHLLLMLLGPDTSVGTLASKYFSITIWGAPLMLASMAIQGWLLGMQTTLLPMIVTISVNLLNIVLSLVFVFGCGMGFEGVAYGTLCASASGFPLAYLMALIKVHGISINFRHLFKGGGMSRFFKVNSDIFFRSVCIMAVSMTVTAIGARLGSLTLAANAIIIQFYIFFSYCMDGFAFTGEALCGRFAGAGNATALKKSVTLLLMWSAVMALSFIAVYALCYGDIIRLLTDRTEVITVIEEYRMWILMIPLLSVLAFIYDGFFIGLTATRRMLTVTAISAAVFFAICFLHIDEGGISVGLPSNSVMWTAFLSYLLLRGVLLAVQSRHVFSLALTKKLPK